MLSVNVVVSKVECVVVCVDKASLWCQREPAVVENRENWNSTFHCGFYLFGWI